MSIEDAQSEIVYQNSKDKDFEDLTDREKYHRAQHYIDAAQRELANEDDPSRKAEIERRIESLEAARDQWKASRWGD